RRSSGAPSGLTYAAEDAGARHLDAPAPASGQSRVAAPRRMPSEVDPLPGMVADLFVEYGPGAVSWERDRDFVIERVLAEGTWDAIEWVRSRAGDGAIRDLLLRTKGRRLSPPQLRLWQLLLDLPEETVTAWIRSEARAVWDGRGP
ncbi:MAG: hypothetical protein L0323_18690, partial [Planctomycetes bacterium]|nr:hypothetical protein [Planctomycetota bacterium]